MSEEILHNEDKETVSSYVFVEAPFDKSHYTMVFFEVTLHSVNTMVLFSILMVLTSDILSVP